MSPRASQLRNAIIDMTMRYGTASMEFASAEMFSPKQERAQRARRRRFRAIQRLVRALAEVSDAPRGESRG